MPAGNHDGGQWTAVSSGGGISIAVPAFGGFDGGVGEGETDSGTDAGVDGAMELPEIVVTADSDSADGSQDKAPVQLVGGSRSTGITGGRCGTNFPNATYGQLIRLDLNIARTESALRQVRQYDLAWKPRTSSVTVPGSIEGAIRDSQDRADEAETRLYQLRTGIGGNYGPPLNESRSDSLSFDGQGWIGAYRTINNASDLFGRPTWPTNIGTEAVTEIDGKLYFGVNSGAPGYSTSDRAAADQQRWSLINEYPDVMETKNIGNVPNDSLYHAEATILLRAANGNGGTLVDRSFEVHVDREMCDSCGVVLPYLGLRLGNPLVTFVDGAGIRRTMWNGSWLTGR